MKGLAQGLGGLRQWGEIINTSEHASRGLLARQGGGCLGLGELMCAGLGSQFLFHDPCPGPEGCHPGALLPSIKEGL